MDNVPSYDGCIQAIGYRNLDALLDMIDFDHFSARIENDLNH
jgi:hypothetical protein